VSEDTLDRLAEAFSESPGPCPVIFELCSADGSVAILEAQRRVAATLELAEAVRQICGERAVLAAMK
jgi:hypothetical protein